MNNLEKYIDIFRYFKYRANSRTDKKHLKEFQEIISSNSVRQKDDYLNRFNKIKESLTNLPGFNDKWDEDKFKTIRQTLVQLVEQIIQEQKNKVFVVHGRDMNMRDSVDKLLIDFGIESVILEKETNEGDTVLEKFIKKSADCNYAIILMSPDDVGAFWEEKNDLKKRARQNVILELGYFLAKLGRQRILILFHNEIEKPSDFDGFVHIPYDKDGDWKIKVIKELKKARFIIE